MWFYGANINKVDRLSIYLQQFHFIKVNFNDKQHLTDCYKEKLMKFVACIYFRCQKCFIGRYEWNELWPR